jgi:hypothetical protein
MQTECRCRRGLELVLVESSTDEWNGVIHGEYRRVRERSDEQKSARVQAPEAREKMMGRDSKNIISSCGQSAWGSKTSQGRAS